MPRDAAAETCPNCGSTVDGSYCANCGQERGDAIRHIRPWISDTIGELIGLDGRLWRTLRTLYLRPGRLTASWIKGERARFLSPVRLYLVSSLTFFAVVAIFGPDPFPLSTGVMPSQSVLDALPMREQVEWTMGSGEGALLIRAYSAFVRDTVSTVLLIGIPFIALAVGISMLGIPRRRTLVDHAVLTLHIASGTLLLGAVVWELVAITGWRDALWMIPAFAFVHGLSATRFAHELSWSQATVRYTVAIVIWFLATTEGVGRIAGESPSWNAAPLSAMWRTSYHDLVMTRASEASLADVRGQDSAGDWEAARAMVDQWLETYPSSLPLEHRRDFGLVLAWTGNPQAALDLTADARSTESVSRNLVSAARAEGYRLMGDDAAAVEEYRRYFDYRSQLPGWRTGYGSAPWIEERIDQGAAELGVYPDQISDDGSEG